jgi:hypothetical protein
MSRTLDYMDGHFQWQEETQEEVERFDCWWLGILRPELRRFELIISEATLRFTNWTNWGRQVLSSKLWHCSDNQPMCWRKKLVLVSSEYVLLPPWLEEQSNLYRGMYVQYGESKGLQFDVNTPVRCFEVTSRIESNTKCSYYVFSVFVQFTEYVHCNWYLWGSSPLNWDKYFKFLSADDIILEILLIN